MRNWQLEIGLYPGILLGVRSYEQDSFREHVLYIPFIELILTVHDD